VHAQSKIKWRMQTYAGPRWPSMSSSRPSTAFNKIANDEMEIELFYADQLVPTGELFRAMQRGTIDAVQSDDDSMAVADRGDRVRRLLPVRLALLARRAGAVQPVRPEGDLGWNSTARLA
jgi:hypothetical protein